jgi:hypothetical protein
MNNKTLLTLIFKTYHYTYIYIMQSSIETHTPSVHNTDEQVSTGNNVDTSTIRVAVIATPEDINNYSLEILDTEHYAPNDVSHITENVVTNITETNIDNFIFEILRNKQFYINMQNVGPIHDFLILRSRVLEYYIVLFIINLIYNVCNIFNTVLFIPLFYYLCAILYPKMIHFKSIPYVIILSMIINICINIGITLNIYIFSIQYINTTIHTSLIFYMFALYFFSLTNTIVQCIFFRDMRHLKKKYIKLETYLLHNQIINNRITQHPIPRNPIE